MLSDMQLEQFKRAENAYLNEPQEPEEDPPRCSCCGCTASNHTELFMYHDEPWCYDCLEYEGLSPDEIDELYVWEEDEL